MVEQSQRREWRKRRRRRKRVRLLLKILIFSVIFCSIGYGGKNLYGKYIAKALRDNPASEALNTEDPADDTKGTNTSNQTPVTDLPENSDTTVNEDLNENPEETQKPDPSMKPEEPEHSALSENSDGTNKPDPTNKPEKEKPKPSEKPKKEEKPTPSEKPEVEEDPDIDEQSEEETPDDENNEEDTEKVDDSYFNDAVFVGDSRTEGFGMYSGLKKATFYSEKGLTVDSIFKDKVVKIKGKKVTIMDALKSHSFGKVYIMLGVNELGWPYEDVFIKQYKKIIDDIKEAQPDAVIYIQSIIHVSKEKDKNPPSYITNKRINSRNKAIKKMAEKENVNYLNVNEVLTDKSGSLFEKAATDGVHLNQKYCLIWKDYLLKHTVK